MKKNLSCSSHVLLGALRESGGLDSLCFTSEVEIKDPVRPGRGESFPVPSHLLPCCPIAPHRCCWCRVPSESLNKLGSATSQGNLSPGAPVPRGWHTGSWPWFFGSLSLGSRAECQLSWDRGGGLASLTQGGLFLGVLGRQFGVW